ncbi:MAG: C4-dicarboxylate ABC transporter permease [Proteobacteria bacterium]|nr:MAG: C4-dicarboxylate ABC transporter permease [Pseudomonadota bacterium]PIE68183.1 MAG: C4-dicarboxylate ABC transporter permease [Deltaproteobacteria bacterium]
MATVLDGYCKLSSFIAKAAAVFSVAVMFFMTGHVIYEIILRTLFDSSTYVLDEFVGYGVAAMTFLSLGYALEHGALIRVNILLVRLKNNILRRAVELISVVLTLCLSLFISSYLLKSITRNYERNAVSETIAEVPLWIPEGLVLLGLCILSMQLISYILKILTGRNLIGDTSPKE